MRGSILKCQNHKINNLNEFSILKHKNLLIIKYFISNTNISSISSLSYQKISMKNSNIKFDQKRIVEFSPGKDPFEKARNKGSRRWIFKHLFYKSNKYIVVIVLITTILTSNLWSISSVLLGRALNDFFQGNSSSLVFYTVVKL